MSIQKLMEKLIKVKYLYLNNKNNKKSMLIL